MFAINAVEDMVGETEPSGLFMPRSRLPLIREIGTVPAFEKLTYGRYYRARIGIAQPQRRKWRGNLPCNSPVMFENLSDRLESLENVHRQLKCCCSHEHKPRLRRNIFLLESQLPANEVGLLL